MDLGLSHLASLYWPQRQERGQLRAPQLEWQSVLSQEQICAHADPSPRTAHAHSLQGIHHASEVSWPWSSLLGDLWHLSVAPQILMIMSELFKAHYELPW